MSSDNCVIPALSDIELDKNMVLPQVTAARKSLSKQEPYLRGPITWCWLHTARQLGPSCTDVGLALWHFRALKKNTTFPLSERKIATFLCVTWRTVHRAIQRLEKAKLITVKRCPGRKSVYTLHERPTDIKVDKTGEEA